MVVRSLFEESVAAGTGAFKAHSADDAHARRPPQINLKHH